MQTQHRRSRARRTTPMPVEEMAKFWRCSRPLAVRSRRAAGSRGALRLATFAAGDTIMRQGDPGNFAYLILEGEADVFVEIPAGRIPMATLGRRNTIGELGAFTDMPRTATVVARTDLTRIAHRERAIVGPAAEFPAIAVAVIGELGRRLHSMNVPLAYLTYAAGALASDEYDPALLTELTNSRANSPISPASSPIWRRKFATSSSGGARWRRPPICKSRYCRGRLPGRGRPRHRPACRNAPGARHRRRFL